jgi:hypothetical protein
MLDEGEWAQLQAVLNRGIEPLRDRAARASSMYERITGLRGARYNLVAHHRVSHWGPPCESCGRPLRPPRVTFCADCGIRVNQRTLAKPATQGLGITIGDGAPLVRLEVRTERRVRRWSRRLRG